MANTRSNFCESLIDLWVKTWKQQNNISILCCSAERFPYVSTTEGSLPQFPVPLNFALVKRVCHWFSNLLFVGCSYGHLISHYFWYCCHFYTFSSHSTAHCNDNTNNIIYVLIHIKVAMCVVLGVLDYSFGRCKL